MTDDEQQWPLLEGRGILPLRYVAERTGVPVEHIKALIRAGLPPDALFSEDGEPLHLWEDSVPSADQLHALLSQMDGRDKS